LGCGGCLKTLRREGVTPYDVSEAVTLDNANQSDIVPLSALLDRWPNLSVSDEEAKLLGNGRQEILQSRSEELNSIAKGSSVLLYASQSRSNEALGLLERSEGGWKIALNFREDE
jgi:tRNA U55 pseudouridine synthase TruB